MTTGEKLAALRKKKVESFNKIKDEIMNMYPMTKQKYMDKEEMYPVIFKLFPEDISIY